MAGEVILERETAGHLVDGHFPGKNDGEMELVQSPDHSFRAQSILDCSRRGPFLRLSDHRFSELNLFKRPRLNKKFPECSKFTYQGHDYNTFNNSRLP